MKWARIENGTVVEVVDVDPAGRYHHEITWTPCPDETGQGWNHSEVSGFSQPPPIDQSHLEEVAADAAYLAEDSTSVNVGGVYYKGGEHSAGTIAAAVNLAQALGETSVTLCDVNLNEHTMSVIDALAVAAAVGVPARAAYFKHARAVKAARNRG